MPTQERSCIPALGSHINSRILQYPRGAHQKGRIQQTAARGTISVGYEQHRT